MPDLTIIGWILSNLGLAGFALYLQDRSHRHSMDTLRAEFDHERKAHQQLVLFLDRALSKTPGGIPRQ